MILITQQFLDVGPGWQPPQQPETARRAVAVVVGAVVVGAVVIVAVSQLLGRRPRGS